MCHLHLADMAMEMLDIGPIQLTGASRTVVLAQSPLPLASRVGPDGLQTTADPLPWPQQFVRDGQSGQSKPRRGHSGAGSGHNLVWPPTDHVILSPLFQSEPPSPNLKNVCLGDGVGARLQFSHWRSRNSRVGLRVWRQSCFCSPPQIYPGLLSSSLGFCGRFGLKKPNVLHLKKCGSSRDRCPHRLFPACLPTFDLPKPRALHRS